MATTHTPGPWRVIHLAGSSDEEGVQHFELWAAAQKNTFAENEANARLMAAAPKMLAALQAAYDVLLGPMPHTPEIAAEHVKVIKQITAAIAKTQGE